MHIKTDIRAGETVPTDPRQALALLQSLAQTYGSQIVDALTTGVQAEKAGASMRGGN